MSRWLIAGMIALPIVLAASLLHVVFMGPSTWSGVVYLSASRVCHQRPERSFRTAGVQWPVCGRCSGIYLGGALGGVLAGLLLRRRTSVTRAPRWLAVAAVPTVATVVAEWTGVLPVGNITRAWAAVPLGLAVAAAIVLAAAGPQKNDRIN